MKIVAVVVTYNRKECLLKNIQALLNQTDAKTDILIIDNASTDGTEEAVASYRDAGQIIYENTGANLGGAGGFNYGVRLACEIGYDYLWLMDDDVYPYPDALSKLIQAHEDLHGDYGYLAGVVLWKDGTECRMNKLHPKAYGAGPNEWYKRIDFSTFVSMFLPRQTVEEFGLPIKEFFIWGDDIEYTRRITAKKPAYMVPESKVLHDTKNNEGFNIAFDDGDLTRYRYAYRNEMFAAMKEGKKRVFRQRLRIWKHMARVMFRSKGRKREKIRLIREATKEGRYFHPEIEYIIQNKNSFVQSIPEIKQEPMNVFFLSDDKFAEIFAVAVESLFTQQKHTVELRVFLIENNISEINKSKLNKIADDFDRKIEYIPMPDIQARIGKELYIPKMLNMVDFARLFAAEILPQDIDKIIQLDCDLILRHPIDELWNIDLGDNYCSMINEGHSARMRDILGIPSDGMYYNSGVVLINLKKWRDDQMGQLSINYMKKMHGYIPVNAQGVINAVMDGKIGLLPLKFNVYALMYAFTYEEFLKLRKPTYYYSKEEYEEALADPYIIHYMTCFYLDARPWMKDCQHPMTNEYLEYREKTPWSDEPLWEPTSKRIRKMYSKFCHIIPKAWAIRISSFIYVDLIPFRHKIMERRYARKDTEPSGD